MSSYLSPETKFLDALFEEGVLTGSPIDSDTINSYDVYDDSGNWDL